MTDDIPFKWQGMKPGSETKFDVITVVNTADEPFDPEKIAKDLRAKILEIQAAQVPNWVAVRCIWCKWFAPDLLQGQPCPKCGWLY